jgi:hypothetical protein
MILMLNLAEHDLAGACAERQCAQVIAVEAAQQSAERLVAERHRRLLDRGRQPLAPPSMIAVNTSPSSRVQVTVGVPSNGGVRKVSSSSATTTAAESCGGYELPKIRQRSAVRISMDQPRNGSSIGEATTRLAASAIERAATAARSRGAIMTVPRRLSPAGSAAGG